jgi:hypothetical protein
MKTKIEFCERETEFLRQKQKRNSVFRRNGRENGISVFD